MSKQANPAAAYQYWEPRAARRGAMSPLTLTVTAIESVDIG